MKKFNKITFIIVIGIIFLLLLYKAVVLPVVCDESITAVTFVNYSIWDIIMYTNHFPNNHILNTLLTKLFVGFFGNEQLIIRLPNLLFFILYGFGIYRINASVLKEDSLYFLPATLLFVSNPYLLDYFGLCRGYGMSCALATLSVSFLITAFKDSKVRHVWIAYFLSMLASYANFTLLVFWSATTLLVLFYFISFSRKPLKKIAGQTLAIVVFTLLYLALIANPIRNMQSSNEFQFWTSLGFLQETVYPLIGYSLSGSNVIPGPRVIAILLFLIIVLNLVYTGIQIRQSDNILSGMKQPEFITTAVLLITALVSVLQCWLLKTPNLHGRTALFFYPLFITVVVAFIGILPAHKHRTGHKMLALCLAFICIFHIADRFKLNWVRDGVESVNTFEVLDFIKKDQLKEPVTLEVNWFLYHSFYYYVFTGELPWLKLGNYNEKVDINTQAEYYYIFSKDLNVVESKFECVKIIGNDRMLVKRKVEVP